MPQLIKLALQLQQALDSAGIASAAVAALAILHHVGPAVESTPGTASASMEPVILRTTLATSIVTYLERIQWAEVTPRILCNPAGTPFECAYVGAGVLRLMFECTAAAASANNGRTPLAALLLRQVDVFPSVALC